MALGDSYATLAEFKTRLGGVSGSGSDTQLTEALSVASRAVEKLCGRQFNKATSATARVYYPDTHCRADVDDFWTTSGLIVETSPNETGGYTTTWTSNDYQLEPLNGVVDGETGWPYYRIRAVAGLWLTAYGYRPGLRVTAQWGWNAVPAAVKEATLVLAEETFKLKDAPFGVAAWGEFGPMRVRDNPMVARMLAPYQRMKLLVG